MRVAVDFRSASKDNYNKFCKEYPHISLTYNEWKSIIYGYADMFRRAILETGEKYKLQAGIGQFSIRKRKRKKINIVDGKEYVNLPIDWKKTLEKGKRFYNFNFHTDGYYFGWVWFKRSARFRQAELWYFKPSRTTSRLLAEYLKKDKKYQDIYSEWWVLNKHLV